ncbi:MAG: hypothetical protein RLZZ301_1675 [Bacteroidota bacterium]
MDESLSFYRKYFGMDIPFFDAVQDAPLMKVFTRHQVIEKRASMVMNLRGGSAMEIIRARSFEPRRQDGVFQLGDIGINALVMRSAAIAKSAHRMDNASVYLDPQSKKRMYVQDPDQLWLCVQEDSQQFLQGIHEAGGVLGVLIGVRSMEHALHFYQQVLGFRKVLLNQTGVFEDWKDMPGGSERYHRIILSTEQAATGGFGEVIGFSQIELIQAQDRTASKIFKGRIWGDIGFVHLGFDVLGMKALEQKCLEAGFPFLCDSQSALAMGNSKVHCAYIADPDGTLIELIEVKRIPIIEKWGIYLKINPKNAHKPRSKYLLWLLRFSRIKEA